MDKVLLLGMGPTAPSALESLTRSFRVAGLLRSSGPSEEVDDVIERARSLGIPVFTGVGIRDVEQAVSETRPECVVVSSYDRILPDRILRMCRFVNVHYAPLPQYRGRANVNWAIINGESEAAITIHTMAPGLDSGNILYQERISIDPHDTAGDLYRELNKIQATVLDTTVARHIAGFEGEPQDEAAATYGCTRVPDDGEIDWRESTEHIYALVRALSPPYPGAYTFLGLQRVSVVRARPLDDPPRFVGRLPGRVVGVSGPDGHVDVLTGDGVLRIYEVAYGTAGVEPASRRITSTRQTLGLRTADLVGRIEMLEARLGALEGRDEPDG